jgi:hypothetical protein
MEQPAPGPNDRHRTLVFALGGAGLLGGIGFVAGFVGPIILAPDANQGPLLGIFITGPIGFVIGGIAGFIYARLSAKRKR